MNPESLCTVVSYHAFLREATRYWDETEYEDFVNYISNNPTVGDEIQGTGGLRKIRWSRPGMGKRGGVRVIYYFHNLDYPIHLIWIYGKSDQKDLTPEEKKAFTKVAETIKKDLKGKSL
jgi:hypothetical protein